MQNLKKIYDPSIDTLRFISILAVVLIHTTTRQLEITHYDLVNNLVTLFFNQAARFAVPLFFLISGFVLELNFDSNINYFVYLKKRLSKLLVPYIFWSFIYYFFIYTKHSEGFLRTILTGDASYQLYFIPSLFIFYLIFPMLHNLRKYLFNKWVLIILFIIQILILDNVYKNFSFPLPYPIAVAVFNYFAFIIGMKLSKSTDEIKKLLNKFWPIFLIGTICLSYFIFNEGKNYYYKTWNFEAFYTQWRPSVLIYTLFIFGILYFIADKQSLRAFGGKFNYKLMQNLSKLSFFVFFVHVIVLETISKFAVFNGVIFFGLTVLISITIAYLIHKLPLVSRLTG